MLERAAPPDAIDPIMLMASKFATASGSLSRKIRDDLILNEDLIDECIKDAADLLPQSWAAQATRQMATKPHLEFTLKRVVVDIGIILSLAKTFDSDEAFIDSVGILNEIDFQSDEGMASAFANAMIKADEVATHMGGDALYNLLDQDRILIRLASLQRFIADRSSQA